MYILYCMFLSETLWLKVTDTWDFKRFVKHLEKKFWNYPETPGV